MDSNTDANPYVVGPSPYDEERLQELYHGEGLTVEQVADRLDRAPGTVSNWMDDFGIERRTRGSIPEWADGGGA